MTLRHRNNFDNITFSELDVFVNEWIVKTKDMEDIFENQAYEVNRLFHCVSFNSEEVAKINDRLNIVKYLQMLLKNVLNVSTQYHKELTNRVLLLESKTEFLYKPDVITDQLRKTVYAKAEDINNILAESKQNLDDTTFGILRSDKLQMNDPLELIARILMRQMYNLENVETNISRISNFIQAVDCKLKKLGCSI